MSLTEAGVWKVWVKKACLSVLERKRTQNILLCGTIVRQREAMRSKIIKKSNTHKSMMQTEKDVISNVTVPRYLFYSSFVKSLSTKNNCNNANQTLSYGRRSSKTHCSTSVGACFWKGCAVSVLCFWYIGEGERGLTVSKVFGSRLPRSRQNGRCPRNSR